MIRLRCVESGHEPEMRAQLEETRAKVGHLDGVDLILAYKPELFGSAFRTATQTIMRGESDWTPGERELIATFVSAQNQCPF